MKPLDRLEKRFGHLAVPNVALALIIAQLVVYGFILTGRVEFTSLLLIPQAVLGGEWWRLISFLIVPPEIATTAFQALFLAFFWYIFWMMSHALESAWGVFRFNLFLLCGILFSVAGCFLGQWVSSETLMVLSPRFLYLSVFFAFATLHPNVEFLLFFVLPVKVKWLAWIAAAFTAMEVLFAPNMGARIVLLAPLLNYFLFFREPLLQSLRARKRRARFEAERDAHNERAQHTCEACGATEHSHPERDFRYKILDGEAVCLCDACRQMPAKADEATH